MNSFTTKPLPKHPDAIAPNGFNMRMLLKLTGGNMAHFELAPGQTSRAIAHRKVDEMWYFLQGEGEMWRKLDDQEEIVHVKAGICATIPVGTYFQIRALGKEPLIAVGMMTPPWQGDGEVYYVSGAWLSDLT